jgi:F0F1-type ATP synthase delta subunit
VDQEVRALVEENERLKRIIARQALEIEVKSELLKKLLSNKTDLMLTNKGYKRCTQ